MDEREIFRCEAMDISQHLMFGVIAIEDFMGQVGAGAGEMSRETGGDLLAQVPDLKWQAIMADEDFQQAPDFVLRAQFIQGNPDRVVLMSAKIDAGFVGSEQNRLRLHFRQSNPNRIEVLFRSDIESELAQTH